MPGTSTPLNTTPTSTRLDRALALFSDVRPGEGTTAVLMLVNVFLLLVCYAVIKTVREPLILLGGGAEVRSYAAAGQALLLIGFVPLYSWVSSRVNRTTLIFGVTLFFIACIELFSVAVAARMPYVGVAFFIWVGIFNMSLVAQFWSFANDIYRKDAADRLFPVIMIGMTGGAPLGSLIAARLFRAGLSPQTILQVSALLLTASAVLYVAINRRVARMSESTPTPLAASGGFALVLQNPYLRLVAALVMLLNIVNTTGEYVVAKLLTAHVAELAALTPGFNKQAFIGAFVGDYQFWVNVTALVLQAFVTSRLVKFRGLQGVLLALPLIALGGYGLMAAGAGFTMVRWIKTAENATDYSIMNTARQLLWVPTSREEKYKAKQAIDTFCVRMGDVVSALLVYGGTTLLHLVPSQFAALNLGFTIVWLGVAVLILRPTVMRGTSTAPRLAHPKVAAGVATAALVLMLAPRTANAQDSRAGMLAQAQEEKAAALHPYEPTQLERRIDFLERHLLTPRTFSPFIGNVMQGGGLAVGPAVRKPFGDTGLFTAHAAWSVRNYGAAAATLALPEFVNGRVKVEVNGERLHASQVAFYGFGNAASRTDRQTFAFDSTTIGASARLRALRSVWLGAGVDYIDTSASSAQANGPLALPSIAPAYQRSQVFAEFDSRTSPGYSRVGGLARTEFSDYRQTNGSGFGFQRIDADVQRFVPLAGESRVIALRATASSTLTSSNRDVPFFELPSLGGHDALRGYSNWRFRDRNRALVSAEYRWTAGPLVDMAVFGDAGTVAPRFGDLFDSQLHTSYGVGISLHTPNSTFARLELARSREGMGVLLSFGPSF